jgi:hypothetical protein
MDALQQGSQEDVIVHPRSQLTVLKLGDTKKGW